VIKIDGIDIYWVRLPLAFVWRTSYADQHHTDTILVRMESQGLDAWGESCPPYIPAYSSEHTLATFHTLREHFYREDIGKPEIALCGPGEIATSRVPGIPQEPDPDLLKRWTVDHASFRVG
jgi:hypothetical protein